MLKDIFRLAILVAHLVKARKGGNFGNKALQNVRIKQQAHKTVHGFGSNLAPFVHDVCGGHIIEHAARGAHNGKPCVGLDGQVKVGGKTQGAHGQQVVVAQGFVRQASQLDGSALDVLKAVISVVR